MRRLLKWFCASVAMAILAVCFTLGLMNGMAQEDELRDAQRKQLCSEMPWPRPAACASFAEAGRE